MRILYRLGSLDIVGRELARYKLDLVCVQEVRWDKGRRMFGHKWDELKGRVEEKT